jgi:hypothetical protein
LKSHHMTKLRCALPFTLRMIGGIAAVSSLLAAAPVKTEAASLSGESNTIFRMGKSTSDKRNLYPAYEYLNFSALDLDKNDGAVSFYFGGWGRVDLADKSTDKYADGDLQYGYLSYRGKQNNLLVNLGRQYVTEGVAAERLDGIYLRNDFAAGFGASAFAGATVVTEPNFQGGDVVYGGRISHSMPKYYTVGVSVLKTDSHDGRFREEEGVDLWLHPCKYIEAVGRSSYNSITSGWMEHAYTVTYSPLDNLRINADVSKVNYKDYLFHMTTSVFSLTSTPGGILDPNEELLTVGGSIAYTPIKNLTLVGDYKHYDYEIAGDAKKFGGKVNFSLADSFAAGLAIHRMDGQKDKFRYYEYRVFASKKIDKLDLTADFFDVNYDSSINGLRNSFTVTGAASYEITEQLKVAADIDYSKNPDFDNEVKGLVKITYAFDTKRNAEGGAKSEKH